MNDFLRLDEYVEGNWDRSVAVAYLNPSIVVLQEHQSAGFWNKGDTTQERDRTYSSFGTSERLWNIDYVLSVPSLSWKPRLEHLNSKITIQERWARGGARGKNGSRMWPRGIEANDAAAL